MRNLLSDAIHDCRPVWKSLAITGLVFKLLILITAPPLLAVMLRIMIAVSGRDVLLDEDILFFFLRPSGWLALVALGALWLAMEAMGLAAQGEILANARQRKIGSLRAIRFAFSHASQVLRLTARIVTLTLLALLPIIALAAALCLLLLSEHDINYYLKERPAAFWIAAGVVMLSLLAAAVILCRLLTRWFVALPLVLFESASPSQALGLSRARTKGQGRAILLFVAGWGLGTVILSSLETGFVATFGRFMVSRSDGSLSSVATTVGATVLLWAGFGLGVALLSTTTFAAIYFQLYRRLGNDEPTAERRLPDAEFNPRGKAFATLRLTVFFLAGMVAAIVIVVTAIRTIRLDNEVEVIAHRGASFDAPENTMAAFEKAIEAGADWIELDVQMTADGNVAVFHDQDFMRLSHLPLRLADATTDDLRRLDIGTWFDGRFESERVPTLDEVLRVCQGRIGVVIELKSYGDAPQLEQRVAEAVEAHRMSSEIVVMSLKAAAVKKMKSIRSAWNVGMLLSVSAGKVDKIEADFLAVNAAFATRTFIKKAHDSGRGVYVWTVNDAVTMSKMIGRGVDGIITDRPALARSVLQQRAELDAAERLLLHLATILGMKSNVGPQ